MRGSRIRRARTVRATREGGKAAHRLGRRLVGLERLLEGHLGGGGGDGGTLAQEKDGGVHAVHAVHAESHCEEEEVNPPRRGMQSGGRGIITWLSTSSDARGDVTTAVDRQHVVSSIRASSPTLSPTCAGKVGRPHMNIRLMWRWHGHRGSGPGPLQRARSTPLASGERHVRSWATIPTLSPTCQIFALRPP